MIESFVVKLISEPNLELESNFLFGKILNESFTYFLLRFCIGEKDVRDDNDIVVESEFNILPADAERSETTRLN